MQNALVRHLFLGEEPFLVLRVKRQSLLDDTVTALRRISPAMYKKPLKVMPLPPPSPTHRCPLRGPQSKCRWACW